MERFKEFLGRSGLAAPVLAAALSMSSSVDAQPKPTVTCDPTIQDCKAQVGKVMNQVPPSGSPTVVPNQAKLPAAPVATTGQSEGEKGREAVMDREKIIGALTLVLLAQMLVIMYQAYKRRKYPLDKATVRDEVYREELTRQHGNRVFGAVDDSIMSQAAVQVRDTEIVRLQQELQARAVSLRQYVSAVGERDDMIRGLQLNASAGPALAEAWAQAQRALAAVMPAMNNMGGTKLVMFPVDPYLPDLHSSLEATIQTLASQYAPEEAHILLPLIEQVKAMKLMYDQGKYKEALEAGHRLQGSIDYLKQVSAPGAGASETAQTWTDYVRINGIQPEWLDETGRLIDIYAVVGVDVSTSDMEGQKACRKVAFQNHEDRVKNLSQDERNAAKKTYFRTMQADVIFRDSRLRAKYDKAYANKSL